jgi:hypothetical protein
MARLALRLVDPRRARPPRSYPFVPHQNAREPAAVTEGETGSSKPVLPERCQLPRAPQYLSACFGYAILESIVGTENLVIGKERLAPSLSLSGGRTNWGDDYIVGSTGASLLTHPSPSFHLKHFHHPPPRRVDYNPHQTSRNNSCHWQCDNPPSINPRDHLPVYCTQCA